MANKIESAIDNAVLLTAAREPSLIKSTMALTKSSSRRTSTSATKKLSAASIVGAPAQHNQSSRKGKKAWRKNVDIEDLEARLEGLREEERTFGCGFLSHKFSSKFECHLQTDSTKENR